MGVRVLLNNLVPVAQYGLFGSHLADYPQQQQLSREAQWPPDECRAQQPHGEELFQVLGDRKRECCWYHCGGQGYHFQQEELKAPEATCTEQRVCRAEIGLPESRTLDQGCHRGLQLPQGPHQACSRPLVQDGRPSKRTPQSASELALAAHKL